MNPYKMFLAVPVLALLCGCHSSSTHLDGQADAAEDVPADSTPDAHTDTPADPVTDPTPPPPSGYDLHEWGVMVMGPGGAVLHGSGPEFAGPIPAKPVIYLYADEPFDLDVAVRFTSGAPTETWPEAPLTPTLLWSGLEVSPGPCSPTPFPSPYDGPGEGFCEACTLSLVVAEDAACVTYGGQVAKLLFYTGSLPEYQPPLLVDAYTYTGVDGSEQVAFDVENRSAKTIEGVWLVHRETTDECIDPSACPVVTADIAWSYLDAVDPDESLSMSLPVEHYEAEVDEHGFPVPGTLVLPPEWNDLGDDLLAALEARGLTAAEARGFMNAWDQAFFGLMGSDSVYLEPLYSNGSQAIYFMTRADYDVHMPLETSAPADEVVRVGMVYETL
jgi:hypothetical protein